MWHKVTPPWSCSPDAEEGRSALSCSDTDPSSTANSSSTGAACSSSEWTTEFSLWPRSGTTSGASTACPGGGEWTSSPAVSRARTLASQDEGLDSTGRNPLSGEKCSGWFARWSPAACSWKTPQLSLLGGSTEFSGTWPRWGMMRRGVCWERETPVRTTSETGSGFSRGVVVMARDETHWPNGMAWWEGAIYYINGDMVDVRLPDGTVECFPREWVLPMCLPTLTKNDAKNTGSLGRLRRNTVPLDGEHRGPLNPAWTEWYMGWPEGWTALQPLEMAKFQQWFDLHGTRFGRP